MGTITAVVIMYLNSNAAYDTPVPYWMLRFTMLIHNSVVSYEEDEAINEQKQQKLAFDAEAGSGQVGCDSYLNMVFKKIYFFPKTIPCRAFHRRTPCICRTLLVRTGS
jgi:hypothetical protein